MIDQGSKSIDIKEVNPQQNKPDIIEDFLHLFLVLW